MTYILVEDFAVRRAVHTVLQANHIIHLGEVPLLYWKSMPCNYAGKTTPISRNLACNWLTCVPLDVTTTLLADLGLNTSYMKKFLLSLLYGQAPNF